MHYRGAVPAALLLLSLASPAAASEQDSLHTDLGSAPTFTLIERNGKQVNSDDLKGKVWVAHFFFTCCTQGCPQTTAQMQRLQEYFRGKKDIALVSFSVWPENDTPETLTRYAADRNADPNQWLFLTGDEKAMQKVVQEGFSRSMQRDDSKDPGQRVVHSFALVLVDRDGRMRGYVDGRDPSQVDRLIERVRALASSRYVLPAVNAVLNGICTVLLILGYVSIRRRMEGLHKVCMWSALVASVVFLSSYLYFHFAVLDGQPTRFRGEGFIRPVYFGVLLSHTVLAVVVAPLAIVTVVLGSLERRPRHVKLARWTLPLWLYVSITGVVVYVMLYQLYPPY